MKTINILVLISCLMLSSLLQAQPPWRAKLFVHFLDSNNQIATDTVWFGCDSLGAEGYQVNLDSLTTKLQWNKVYCADDVVKNQFSTDCANLKQNIIGFKKQKSSFRFYAFGKPISMSWDTLDFRYFDSSFKLSNIDILPVNGFVHEIDGKGWGIGGDSYVKIGNNYYYQGFSCNKIDSIRVLPETLINGCNITSDGFVFDIEIYIGWWDFTGFDDLFAASSVTAYPNPFNNKIFIENDSPNFKTEKVAMYDINGNEIISSVLAGKNEMETSEIKPGLYFLYILNDQPINTKPIKMIKL